MRRPAWHGTPPRDAREARARIIDTAMRTIDTRGAGGTSISSVALALGVTRQTVYRHFPSTEELFTAVGFAAVDRYVTALLTHLGDVDDPADFVVEAMAYTIERLPDDRYLTVLLAAGEAAAFSRRATTEQAFAACRAALEHSRVDWPGRGWTGADLDGLSEFLVRVMLSFLAEAAPTRHDPAALRVFLRRWVGPAIHVAADPVAVRHD
ncbi:TetR/AcrR family transcriptional regulator [Nocardia thailandica]